MALIVAALSTSLGLIKPVSPLFCAICIIACKVCYAFTFLGIITICYFVYIYMLMCYVLINGNCIGLHTVYQKFGVSKSFFMKEIPIFKIVKDHVTLKT